MIGRLNHVAIAVPDLEAAVAQYRDTLGADVGAPQDEPDHGVTVEARLGEPAPSHPALGRSRRSASSTNVVNTE